MKFIDIHTHNYTPDPEIIHIVNLRSDFSNRHNLKNVAVSFGIHPWDIPFQFDIKLFDEVNRDNSLLAIGECGLDNKISLSVTEQKPLFIQQIEISEQYHKPLIIHCVGAFNELIDLRKQIKPAQPWIIHGFTGHPHLASQLFNHGMLLSFGHQIFKDNSNAAKSLIKALNGAFFLETDDSMLSIKEVYSKAASLRNETLDNIKHLLYNQFKTLFKLKDGVV